MLLLALLFILLSPGVLITLPPVGRSIFMTRKTSLLSVIVHSILFVIVYSVLISYKEGYQGWGVAVMPGGGGKTTGGTTGGTTSGGGKTGGGGTTGGTTPPVDTECGVP